MTPTYLATLRDRAKQLERDDLPAQAAEVERVLKELEGMAAPWDCVARKQSLPEPADCGWPTCDCDPYASKVIAVLEESGALAAPPPAPELPAEVQAAVDLVAALPLRENYVKLLVKFGLAELVGDDEAQATPLGRALLERARSLT